MEKKNKKSAAKKPQQGTILDPSAPVNKVEFDPELKTDRPNKAAPVTEDLEAQGLREALNVMQRIHRGQVLRRHQPKIQRARERAAHRIANMTTLMRRARHGAVEMLRKKVAGERGAHYSELPLADRATIDRFIEKRKKMIGKLAKRLLPKIRKAEYSRMSSFHKGKPLKSLHTEELMEMMVCDYIDKYISESAFAGIIEKANKTGVQYEILEEVMMRGMFSTGDQRKAFDRVNAFLAGGKSALNEDYDLYQLAELHNKINEEFAETFGPVEIGTDEMVRRFKSMTPGETPDTNVKFKRKFKKDV